MTVGTSDGGHFEDEFHMMTAPTFSQQKDGVVKPPEMDTQMSITPRQLQKNQEASRDSKNIYNDSGDVVDSDFGAGKNGPYDTPLPKGDRGFQDWKAQHAPNDSGVDYDLQGAYLGGATPAENGHFPDTWKKPNHPTFSNESKYYKDSPDSAGSWQGETFSGPGMIHPIGSFLGKHPKEGTPEYEQWNRDWSRIERIPDKLTEEEYMKLQPEDTEGSLLPWHESDFAKERGDKSRYMILRKKPQSSPEVPMS